MADFLMSMVARNQICVSDERGFALAWNLCEILVCIINFVVQANPFALQVLIHTII